MPSMHTMLQVLFGQNSGHQILRPTVHLSHKGKTQETLLAKQKLAHWVMDAITMAYRQVRHMTPTVTCHTTRSVSSSWTLLRCVALQEVIWKFSKHEYGISKYFSTLCSIFTLWQRWINDSCIFCKYFLTVNFVTLLNGLGMRHLKNYRYIRS